MSDQEPCMKLNLDGQETECTRQNTMLFTFIGENALYSHIFITLNEETNRRTGAFVFKALFPDTYNQMLEYMAENEYPAVVNQLSVPQSDQDAFNKACYTDIESNDSFPEDWLAG